METEKEMAWSFEDEVEYDYIKLRYSDRKKLSERALETRKAAKDIDQANPLYHRIAVTAEMAKLRCDMAYMVDRMEQLQATIGAMSYIHQQVDILTAAFGYQKMLGEKARIDYGLIAKALKEVEQLKVELSNGTQPRSQNPDGSKGNILPSEAG